MALDDGVNLEDEDAEDEDMEDEDDAEELSDTEASTEVGGGEGESPDGEKPSGATLSGFEQLQQLLKDPEVQQTFQETLADYQARMAASAASEQEAEAFQKMLDDEDWEGVGKAVKAQRTQETVEAAVRTKLTQELFTPVYQSIFAEPEMQKLTAEDREKLHLDNFPSPAAHVAALKEFVAGKRFEAQVEAEVAKRVESAMEAAKNKEAAGKAKAPTLAGRSPAPVGVIQPKLSSSDLIKSGLRSIIGETNSDDDD